MKLSQFFRTTSFRLSLLYLVLFMLSFAAVGIAVYVLSARTLDQQIKDGITLEITALQAEYKEGGLPALQKEIEEKRHTTATMGLARQYGVLDSDGTLVVGTVGNFARIPGWQRVIILSESKNTKDDDDFLNIEVVHLSGQYWLGVGYHADFVEDALDAIVTAFSWGVLLVLILGAAGGYILTRSFLGKIESITRSTQAIIAGDLKHRLEVGSGHDELDNLASLMNRMLDEICDLIDNIQQVSSDIAHDLRTPVSHLKFRLENILNDDLTEKEYREKVSAMVRDVDQILNTFSALLRISQIESGSRRSGFSDVSLTEVIEAVSDALEPVAEEKGKHLKRDIHKGVSFWGDKELLTQMAYNLVENAIVHSGSGQHIGVSLSREAQSIILHVSDDGSGIPDAEKDKVFRRFYRVEASRTTPGNGLGLNIVAAIADLHNARIELSDNNPGLRISVIFDG